MGVHLMLSLSGDKGYGYTVQGLDCGVNDGEGSDFQTILNRNLISMLQFKSGARRCTLWLILSHSQCSEFLVQQVPTNSTTCRRFILNLRL
jgi:hypothetical protein